MMDANQARQAAMAIWQNRQNGTLRMALPGRLTPRTRTEGYLIQDQYKALAECRTVGWKIAATSDAGQAHIGIDGPIAGRLLSRFVFEDGAELAFGSNQMAVAEAEFAFRMGTSLTPRVAPYTHDDVMAAVAGLHTAIEIPNSRFRGFETVGAPLLIADNACAQDFVLGSDMPAAWRGANLADHRVTLGNATGVVHEGAGANVLTDPRTALVWIANELSRTGRCLYAGDIVSTGTCTVPLPITPGDTVTADFGVLGRVSVSLTPA